MVKPKPSFVLDTTNPQSQPVHSPDICHSPDDPPPNVEKPHLSESASTTTNLNETCSLDTSCGHLLHLDSPSLTSELLDNSIVESIESESVPDFEGLIQLDSTSVSSHDTSSFDIEFVPEHERAATFHQQMFSVYNMTMTCPYSTKRLILHLTISIIRTLMSVKSKIKMTSSSVPPTLATTLHYPNSWHNTTVKT